MMLKDITVSGGKPAPYTTIMDYMHGKEGNTIMVNGQVNPVLSMRPGQVQRWRMVNASTARFYKLALDGHTLYVIGTDGGLLDKPYPQSYMLLSPGERLDVLVQGHDDGGQLQAPVAAVLAHGHDELGADHAADGQPERAKVTHDAAERGQPQGDARQMPMGTPVAAKHDAEHEHGARLHQRPGLRRRPARRRPPR